MGLRCSSIIIGNRLYFSSSHHLFLYFYLFMFRKSNILIVFPKLMLVSLFWLVYINHHFLLSISIALLMVLLLLNGIMMIKDVKRFITGSTHHLFGGSSSHSCSFLHP